MHRIVAVIAKTCKKLDISYKSPHHWVLADYKQDVRRLSSAVFRLKQIEGLLVELQEKYNINDLQKVFTWDEDMLHTIEHHLVTEAQKIIDKMEKGLTDK
jgi:hypothetical protein